jgi:hypothetical protein
MRHVLATHFGGVHNWPAFYASELRAFVAFLATMGLLIAGYASLWLRDPKRKPRPRP